MNSCPVCHQPLKPVRYEGNKVFHCPACKGYLLERVRLEFIKNSTGKPSSQLKAEAASDFKGSTLPEISCPQCAHRMHKQRLEIPVLNIMADVCERCSLVWLDGGELALVQLAHEASPRFVDARELNRRIQAVDADPDRKAAFEQDLARLPADRTEDDAARTSRNWLIWFILRLLFHV